MSRDPKRVPIKYKASFKKTWYTWTIFWPSEMPWYVNKCITEEWWWYSETTEITITCSKQTQSHFWSVLSRRKKNTLFRVYCMPMHTCQLWSKYTQVSMKRWRAACNNAYRIIHYIPTRNVSVSPHQVTRCVRTLMPCWETICIDFLYDSHLHLTFLFDRFKCLMPFTNLHSPQLFKAPV